MNADTYATALFRALSGAEPHAQDQMLERFIGMVRSRRHERLLPAIVRSFERKTERAQQKQFVHVTFADTTDTHKMDESIQKDLQALGVHGVPHITTQDQTLIGGYVINAHGKRLDASYKNTLLQMYHSLIRP